MKRPTFATEQRRAQEAQARELPLTILLAEVTARGYQVIPPLIQLPPLPFEAECEVEADEEVDAA